MKKLLCIFCFLCFVIGRVFAFSPDGIYKGGARVDIPMGALESYLLCLGGYCSGEPVKNKELIKNKYGFSKEQIDAMLDRAAELHLDGMNWNTIFSVCSAGGIKDTQDCYDKIYSPFILFINRLDFPNVCNSGYHGKEYHCVDDVFVKEYTQLVQDTEKNHVMDSYYIDKKTGARIHGTELAKIQAGLNDGTVMRVHDTRRNVTKPLLYAQDVSVYPSVAFGFAFEYAKLHYGDDIICLDKIKDNWINCTTYDNLKKYSFKFKEITNRDIGQREENGNIVRGLCAMFDRYYNSLEVACEGPCIVEFDDIANKFGRSSKYESIGGEDFCKIFMNNTQRADLKTYPGKDYMTNAFEHVQANVGQKADLERIIQAYVKLQGIEYKSFKCDYAASGVRPEPKNPEGKSYLNINEDDKIGCRIDDTQVDFVFDDLYETKDYAKDAGAAGMSCLLAPGALAEKLNEKFSTRFDGVACLGPGEKICNEMGKFIPGGTKWDADADRCVLNDAHKAAVINETINLVVDGVVIAASIISGAGVVVVIATAVTSLGVTVGQKGLERFLQTSPNRYAKDFAEKAVACNISEENDVENNSCNVEQTKCAKETLTEYMGTVEFILEGVSDDQAAQIAGFMGNISQCITESEGDKIAEKASMKAGVVVASGAMIGLMVLGFVDPANVNKFRGFTRFPKAMRWLKKFGDIRLSKYKIGEKLYKIDLNPGMSVDKLTEYTKKMEMNGFSVDMKFDEKTGKQWLQITEISDVDYINFTKYQGPLDALLYSSETKRYEEVLKLAKKELSPQEYLDFEKILEHEYTRADKVREIEKAEQNLRANGFSEENININLRNQRAWVEQANRETKEFLVANPKIKSFIDRYVNDFNEFDKIRAASQEADLARKQSMTAKLSEMVDKVALRGSVKKRIDNIIAKVPKQMYQKALNWSNMSLDDRKLFILNELEPVLKKSFGLGNKKLKIGFDSVSSIGGAASYSAANNTLLISVERLSGDFNSIFSTLVHENVHFAQHMGKSLISKEIFDVAERNYIKCIIDLAGNKSNPFEIEAYMTGEFLNNPLSQIAKYHNW